VHERQANSFVANILVRERSLRRNMSRYATVSDAAHHFNVSRASMRWRLKNLRLLDQVQDDT
jgi:Zn-dependent peptidase ImmA (M78 family)